MFIFCSHRRARADMILGSAECRETTHNGRSALNARDPRSGRFLDVDKGIELAGEASNPFTQAGHFPALFQDQLSSEQPSQVIGK